MTKRELEAEIERLRAKIDKMRDVIGNAIETLDWASVRTDGTKS